MKARITLISAALLIQSTILFATTATPSIPAVTATRILTLSPTTPCEATFEDVSIEMVSTLNLAPATPATADFDDEVYTVVDNGFLAPSTPSEAYFE